MSAQTRFTELFVNAFSAMRNADVERHIAKARLKNAIKQQYRDARQRVPSDTMLDAEMQARASKEYPTVKATSDYMWARDEAMVMAAYETAELQRQLVEQSGVIIDQNRRILELLNNRLPHKVV